MSTNMFEIAARNKFRFPFKGMISTEDLWDLSVENLDNVFKMLNSEMKKTKEESLLSTKSKDDEVLELKIEIVKHIVAVKQEEKEVEKRNSWIENVIRKLCLLLLRSRMNSYIICQ